MRVALVINSLAPGGAERSLAELTPPLIGRGVEPYFFVLHDGPGLAEEVRAAGARVEALGGSGRWESSRILARRLRMLRPDLVHTTLFDADVVGRVAARLVGIPAVSSLVNTPYGPEYFEDYGRWRLRPRGAQAADYLTARTVRRFRAVSNAVKDAYVERVHLRPHLVDVIPEGRDPERLGRRTAERRQAIRAALAIGDDPMVLAVGRQDPQKGFDVLLRAFPMLLASDPTIRVLVAGRRGRASGQLEAMVEGLGSRVCFLDERSDVAELLCAADVFVLPSRREGIPGVVQEAMALEAPIVASDIGPVREAVGDPPLAELVPVEDPAALAQAVQRVISDPVRAAERASSARDRFLAEFSISAIADRMVRFYEVASSPMGRRP